MISSQSPPHTIDLIDAPTRRARQVSLGHFFTYWARGAGRGVELGGGNAVLMFLIMSGFIMTVGYAGKGPADGGCCGPGCCRGLYSL